MVVVTAQNQDNSASQFNIELLSLATGKRETVVDGGSWPRYLSTGHILYAQYATGKDITGFTGGMLAVPFDLKRMVRTGPPFPVFEGVRVGSGGAGQYDVSATGTLVYAPGMGETKIQKNLAWADRKGKVEKLSLPAHHYDDLRVSPDGTRVALTMQETTSDVYLCDLQRGTLQRMTFDANNGDAVFTPDGRRLVYSSNSGTNMAHNLWWRPADGSGTPERLTNSTRTQALPSISPDGKFVAFVQSNAETGADIHVLSLDADPSTPPGTPRQPRPFLNTQFVEIAPVFSPNGKWIAYMSNESGGMQVYVQPFPGPGGKWQISTNGGGYPVWSRDSQTLYYVSRGERLMSVDITTQPSFRAGTPKVVAEGLDLVERTSRNYDVAPDGRILFAPSLEQPKEPRNLLHVVENFFTEIRNRTSGDKKP
jgi:serine/threonine-protein kinase